MSGSTPQKSLTEYDAAEASVYRWKALANYYKEQGMLARAEPGLPLTGSTLQKPLTEYDAAEASAYRWEAMANYYKEHGMLTRAEPVRR